jgi:NADP-dependent 3-hydroxy acid dehydrogenase YdfG/Flp pilus assembly protein TadD
MQAKQIHFLYAAENQDLATKLTSDLRSSYLKWHENESPQQLETMLSQRGDQNEHIVLVFVSDNFLKSAECMKRLLTFTQDETLYLLLPVLVEGRRPAADGSSQWESYATQISTIQDTIFYRDFWYDEWIRLRKQGNLANEEELKELEAHKNFSKKMQPMMNTILRHINNAQPKTLPELEADDYQLLFAKIGLPNLSPEERKYALSQALADDINDATELVEEDLTDPAAEEIADAFSLEIAPKEDLSVSLPEGDSAFAFEFEDIKEDTTEAVKVPEKSALSSVLDQYREQHDDAVTETSQADLNARLNPEPTDNKTETPTEEPEIISNLATITDNDSHDFQLAAETNIYFDIPQKETKIATVETVENIESVEAVENIAETVENVAETVEVIEVVETETIAETVETETETETMTEAEHQDHSELVFEDYNLSQVDDIDILLILADTETEESDFDNAAQCFERILALAPANGRALLGLARLYAQHLNRKADADLLYRKALLFIDENAQIYYEYANFIQDHLPTQRRRAVELYRDAIDVNPRFDLAYLGLAKAYQANGQRDAARAAYLQACLLRPELQSEGLDTQLQIIRPAAPEVVEVVVPIAPEIEAVEEIEEIAVAAAQIEIEPNPNAETVVFITGATAGIGQATAERFVKEGYRVIINGRRTERLIEFRSSFDEATQAQICCLPFDVRNADDMQAALASLPEEFKNIAILVNNAGLAKGSAPIHEGKWSDWDTMIDTNLKALLALTRAVAPNMVANQRGHIINIGSAAAKDAYPNGNVYCATKAAVDMLTRAMRLDLYTHNIRVTAINPGMVETEFALVRYEDEARAAKLYENMQPLTPEDVADAIYFAATRPAHVNIQDVLMYCQQQAITTTVNRSGK